MANWSDAEVRELLTLRAEHQISRQFTGTVKDSHLLEQIAKRLVERGFNRDKKQVTSKLKVLKKKFYEFNDNNQRSGRGRCEWPYFELCSAIWGSSQSGKHVTLTENLDEESPGASSSPADEPAAAAAKNESVDATEAEEKLGQMKTSPSQPRRKRRRTRRQDAMEELREFIRVEQAEAERERLRLEQQRAADEEWQRQTVLSRQQQMEAINRTQQLIERHMAFMENQLLTHQSSQPDVIIIQK